MCDTESILEDFYSKERSDDRVARMCAALRGEEYKKYVSKGLIKDLPDNFKEWASENEERQKNWASTPYFIKDNFVDGDLSKGVMYIQKPKPLTILERAAIRHENRTPEQAQAIQARWDERSASRLMAKSEEIKDEVQAFAVSVAAEFGGRVTPVNLKTRASIIRKLGTAEVNHEAREIKDAVRTTIMVDSDKVDGVRSYFKQIKSSGGNVQRIKVQAGSVFLGYTGTIVNINGANGLTAEIQVNTPKMIYAKEPPEDAKRIIGEALWRKIQRETGLPGGLGHNTMSNTGRSHTNNSGLSLGERLPVSQRSITATSRSDLFPLDTERVVLLL
nr:hypothetical protein [uncultured Porphyromonas sp.]